MIYIFWSGGYDSTFRVLQILFETDELIQPIYIADPTSDGPHSRENRADELLAMRRVVYNVCADHPDMAPRIMRLFIVTNVELNREVRSGMYKLYKLGHFSRPVSQYSAMSQVSISANLPIEECAERGDNTIIGKLVESKLDGNNAVNPVYKELAIFRNLRFPIINLTKKDMLARATERGYAKYLYLSVSCWYPVNGVACMRCEMCHDRII